MYYWQKTDHLGIQFKATIRDYLQFFKGSQGAFKGEKETYTAKDGTIDQPGKRANKSVITTVTEKLKWFKETQAEYIDALFAQEATNATGTAKTELKVGEISFGILSSLELLRLKIFN